MLLLYTSLLWLSSSRPLPSCTVNIRQVTRAMGRLRGYGQGIVAGQRHGSARPVARRPVVL